MDPLFNDISALHYAAVNRAIYSVRFYLDRRLIKIDCLSAPSESVAAVQLAAWGGHTNIVEYLYENGADISMVSTSGWTVLQFAVDSGNLEVVQMLVQLGVASHWHQAADIEGRTPLILAHGNSDQYVIDYLRNHVLPPERGMNQLSTLQHRILAKELEIGIYAGDLQSCQIVHGIGCPLDFDLSECCGCSPLLLALQTCKYDIAEWLLKNGASTTKACCGRPNHDHHTAWKSYSRNQRGKTKIWSTFLWKSTSVMEGAYHSTNC